MLTGLWLIFCALWAAKSLVLRYQRNYASERVLRSKNSRFKYVSYIVFFLQIFLVIPTFYFSSPWLLKFHNEWSLKVFGMILCYLGLALYLYSIKHLGSNYSPCFDSHLPFQVVTAGPYRWIRHPGWVAKNFVAVGGILLSGSLWFAWVWLWLLFEMKQTICSEEKYLLQEMPDYARYKSQTPALIPFLPRRPA